MKNVLNCWLKDNHHELMVPKLTGMGTSMSIISETLSLTSEESLTDSKLPDTVLVSFTLIVLSYMCI